MKMYSLIVASVLFAACSETPTSPSKQSAAPFVGDGSASVGTMSLRDEPLGHNDCPSGPVSDFKVNPLGGEPKGRVVVQFRPVSDRSTVTGYWLETQRENDERPGGYEPKQARIVQPEDDHLVFTQGSYLARITPMCLGKIHGSAAEAVFTIDGPKPEWHEPKVCEGQNPLGVNTVCLED